MLWVVMFALTLLQAPSDAQLEESVWARLKQEKLDQEVAEIVVRDSVVILRGKPSNAFVKMKAIETALAVDGVESVEDDLEVAAPESDEDLAKDLVRAVLTYPNYTVFDDVGFQLGDGGLVVITGYVTMGIKKRELEERIGKVRGVRQLRSVIEVLPSSSSDDDLRQRLFDSIYGSETFINYGHQTHKPIRIIVNGPNVMLTGVVRTKLERIQAESIARSTFGVINIDNRLQSEN